MNKLPISLCIISGAEEHRIGNCLRSAAEWTSEIIVVLNEDVRDATESIATGFGARVHRHPWQGFREQKNLALSLASQQWILSLDADEEVSPELRESIFNFFSDVRERFSGADFARKVWFMGRWITHGDWYPDRVLRLFRREKGKWSGTEEHCAIAVEGTTITLRGDLLHYSNPNISGYISKINYFADVHLRRQLAEGAKWSASSTVFRAAWRFVRSYFLRRGFLDGYPGFFIAASTAYSTLVKHTRLFEHGQPAKPLCAPAKSP